MAKTETAGKYELVNPEVIATVKLLDRRVTLDKNSSQALLELAYKSGHTAYVKKAGE